ncbi:hypothetical protein Ahy_B01g056423 [Arachis hypogaea]|uniref:Aminotransferase-like plant mobile domain-containing protein n=1 Tax=Arachis hypogaea TaxID=3818 RepID=A0A445AYT0_ARAHY|nr:hypothetical protein Ahy_B01g056423 [Arachis hypogaea]
MNIIRTRLVRITPFERFPKENDPDSIQQRLEQNTQPIGDDPERLYRLDGVAHIAGVINDEDSGFACGFHSVSGFHKWFPVLVIFVTGFELLGVIPPPSQVQKFVVNCTWFEETFGECPEGANEETVRCFARAYIMMLLGTQLFADKSGNRIHIRWLPYVARLEEMGTYGWGSAALA